MGDMKNEGIHGNISKNMHNHVCYFTTIEYNNVSI